MRRMINPKICRAGRQLLGWYQEELAERAGVGVATVRQYEAGHSRPIRATLKAMMDALEAGGVEFVKHDNGRIIGVTLPELSYEPEFGADTTESNE